MITPDVRLVVDGTTFERCWTSLEVTQDARTWPGQWRFTAKPLSSETVGSLRDVALTASCAEVYVDGTRVSRGRSVAVETGISRDEGTWMNVSGAGPLGPAGKASMPLGHSCRGMTVKAAIEKALEPWDVTVVGSNEANRSSCVMRTTITRSPMRSAIARTSGGPVSAAQWNEATGGDARILQVPDDRAVVARPGETVAEWLRRFLRQMKLLAWETQDGGVFVGLPNYDQSALFTIIVPEEAGSVAAVEGQVVRATWSQKPGDLASEVTCTGRVDRWGGTKAYHTEYDFDQTNAGWYSPRLIVDDQLRDAGKLAARARFALAAEQLEAYTYEVTLAGHGVGRFLPAVDTMINVRDPVNQVEETLWCAARTFAYDRDSGATVRLSLVRPNLFLPEPESES